MCGVCEGVCGEVAGARQGSQGTKVNVFCSVGSVETSPAWEHGSLSSRCLTISSVDPGIRVSASQVVQVYWARTGRCPRLGVLERVEL